ncbi:MAG: hypothetical protein IKV41_00785 [Oscillospiraceae bacterium]|nr:hypothetical protein [Oscillospiraceae bacterium]
MNNWKTQTCRETDAFVPILSKEQEEALFGDFLKRKKHQDDEQECVIGFIWIDGAGCGGELASVMEIERVYPVKCIYMPSVMNGVGITDEWNLEKIKTPYFLLVSGGISFGRGEMETRYKGKILTSWEVIEKLAVEAVQVILLGDCACECLKKKFKNAVFIPGCPVKSEYLEMVFKEMSQGSVLKIGVDGLPVWYKKPNVGVGKVRKNSGGKKQQRRFVRGW